MGGVIKSFIELLELLENMIPKGNTLSSCNHEVKKKLCPMDLDYKKYMHVLMIEYCTRKNRFGLTVGLSEHKGSSCKYIVISFDYSKVQAIMRKNVTDNFALWLFNLGNDIDVYLSSLWNKSVDVFDKYCN
ncbi:hypothetical protein CR513_56809, partial [Mucuna pruriens]